MDLETERGPPVRRPQRARSDAGRERRGPVGRAAVPGRTARIALVDPASVPTTDIDWRPAHRIVASRLPPVGPWDRIARPEDFEALAEIEGLTNARIREEMGTLSLVPRERRVVGPGSTPVMAAFTHLNPEGSRFSDGSFGVLYVSAAIETAIRETVFHRERFLERTNQPPLQVQMRRYVT